MMTASAFKYRLSFSTGGLFIGESANLASSYLQRRDWDAVSVIARQTNSLQFRTAASTHRTVRELIARLKMLSDQELEWLTEEGSSIRGVIMWLSVCRLYLFIAEFMTELVQERLSAYRYDLTYDDFDAFLDRKAEWHEEVETLTANTRKKIRQILFRMMREAGILTSENKISSPVPTASASILRDNLNDGERAFVPGWRL